MMNLRNPDLPDWPDDLRPIGENSFEKESFADWWQRHGTRLKNLHPQIAEQWIHRHWMHSHFSFLPLERLTWRTETWASERIVKNIVRYRHEGVRDSPADDYRTFQRRGGDDRHRTAKALDSGTWDYPIVVLETPKGFVDARTDRPRARYVLIEGHLRIRYLKALLWRGHHPLGPHEVFLLTLAPDTSIGS